MMVGIHWAAQWHHIEKGPSEIRVSYGFSCSSHQYSFLYMLAIYQTSNSSVVKPFEYDILKCAMKFFNSIPFADSYPCRQNT